VRIAPSIKPWRFKEAMTSRLISRPASMCKCQACRNSAGADSFAALATLESRMTHIAGFERDQLLLLPEAVDDYVDAENPVRFIDAFVDGLDLAGTGFARVEAKATGRPGYAPGDLLKLYIYGYLNRI
jgi:hypothetical protein